MSSIADLICKDLWESRLCAAVHQNPEAPKAHQAAATSLTAATAHASRKKKQAEH
jgi:hypothetical protein